MIRILKKMLITIIFIVIIQNIDGRISKCCDYHEVLTQNRNETTYKCIGDNNTIPLKLQVNNNLNVNLLKNCSNNQTCVDKTIVGSVVKLNCMKNVINDTIDINNLYKCCPINYYYNYHSRGCEEVTRRDYTILPSSFYQIFYTKELNNVVHGFPNCTGPIVDYNVNKNDIISYGSGEVKFFDRLEKKEHEVWLNSSCFDVNDDNDLVLRVCGTVDVCNGLTCVLRCCPFGKTLIRQKNRGGCKFLANDSFLPENVFDKNNEIGRLSVIHKTRKCTTLMYDYNLTSILKNGTLKYKSYYFSMYEQEYCLENVYSDDSEYLATYNIKNGSMQPYVCKKPMNKEDEKSSWIIVFVNILTIFSCIFLLITLVVYILLPDLHNTHGKTIMCHTAMMLLAFIFLSMVKLPSKTDFTKEFCLFTGYIINYSFIATFSWLNAMCFDIWWTFGSIKSKGFKKNIDTKFLWYCLYGFGLPAILTLILIFADLTQVLPEVIKPHIGTLNCFYNDQFYPWAKFIYFILPIGIQIISNLIFFILTVRYFYNVRSNIMKMTDSQQKKKLTADKQTLITICKLAFIMGISWIGEIISNYVKDGKIFWHIIDFINASQGIWIFIIFLMKPRVWKSIRIVLGIKKKEEITNVTSTTNVSSSKNSGLSSDSRSNTIINTKEYVELLQKEKDDTAK